MSCNTLVDIERGEREREKAVTDPTKAKFPFRRLISRAVDRNDADEISLLLSFRKRM